MRSHASFGALLLFVPVLQISHRRRLRSLVAKDRVDQRVHDVLYQPVYRADLCNHEGRVFGFDAKNYANFELHREAVFRNHLERIERVCDLARSPFNGLVRRRYHNRSDREGVDIVTTRPNDGLLDAAKPGRHNVSFVCALIQSPVRGVIER